MSGIRTQSSWWLLLLFANIFENGNLICKLFERDCSVQAYYGHRGFTSVQPSLCQVLITLFPFMLVNRDGNSTRINRLFSYGTNHLLLLTVWIVTTQGVHANSLDQTPHLHIAEVEEGDSHPWIFHMAFDQLGINRYQNGGLSLAPGVSAGFLRDLGW